jgi:hypothetical protein
MPKTMIAAIANVDASARKRMVVDLYRARIAPATANPIAPASMLVAVTIELAFPT